MVKLALENSIAYWNDNIDEYSSFEGRFVFRPNASDPDILVIYERQVVCSGNETAIGCAPIYRGDDTVTNQPSTIKIESGYIKSNTTQTIKHEFGHVLGIEHNTEPMPLMAPSADVTHQSIQDAHDRSNPWYTRNLSIYIEYNKGWYDNEKERYKKELQHAVDYYDEGAKGHVPTNISFAWTRNRSEAEILFRFPNDPPCGEPGEDVSCFSQFGHDLDTDPAHEYHVNATISITDIPEDRVAWHAGYWLGFAMGSANVSDLPPPFDEPQDDPHEEWWK